METGAMPSAKSVLPARIRYDGPYSMDLGNPAQFSMCLLQYVMLWEVPRFLSGWFFRRRWGGKDGKANEEFTSCAPSYVMSFVHAIVVGGLGILVLSGLWDCPLHDKFFINDATPPQTLKIVDVIERTNWVFFGYMMDDLAHVLARYPKLGKMDMVAHHLVFIVCSILAGYAQIFVFPFSWLLIGELSTPLLTVKWFLRQSGLGQSKRPIEWARKLGFKGKALESTYEAASAIEYKVSEIFVAVFFVVRVCAYGAGLTHLSLHLIAGDLANVPPWPRYTVLGIIFAGAALNGHWFRIMITKALGLGGGSKRKGGKAEANSGRMPCTPSRRQSRRTTARRTKRVFSSRLSSCKVIVEDIKSSTACALRFSDPVVRSRSHVPMLSEMSHATTECVSAPELMNVTPV